jgi:NAD(P)-dependent dehydrogenase (short-subunit alcohol dehydrogenase family)
MRKAPGGLTHPAIMCGDTLSSPRRKEHVQQFIVEERMDLFNLSGRIAIVTGGNSGIGYAIAEGLARYGAHIVIANRRPDQGEKAKKRILSQNLSAEAVTTDIANPSSVAALADTVMSRHGRIDILVNSAGVILRKPVEDMTEDEYDAIMDINLRGTFMCCRDVGRHMIQQGKGKIINISSNVSQVCQPNRTIYAASKAGISHMTRGFALEWATRGVNVNAIGPGPTLTELNEKHFTEHPEDLEALVRNIPMARVGHPADCVGAAVFLASDASDYITGQTLLVDGGSTLL